MSFMESLRIALLGYGRMGREIEKTAEERNHRIILRIDNEKDWTEYGCRLKEASIAIDFSTPASTVNNMLKCFEADIPVVVGTTGWDRERETIRKRCMEEGKTVFASSNFSIGVHLFMATARFLARQMENQPEYRAGIEETHHIHKLDKPSGTAVSLAQNIIASDRNYRRWELVENGNTPNETLSSPCSSGKAGSISLPSSGTLPIRSLREGEIVGVHRLFYDSDIDRIKLIHEAKSRKGFALGAVKAAEWVLGKKGFFGMDDMLGF